MGEQYVVALKDAVTGVLHGGGGGGSFQFDFPGVSKGITEKKIQHIRETGACCVVTGCPGCRVTIGGNMGDRDRITVLHPMQLLDMALSGKNLHEFKL